MFKKEHKRTIETCPIQLSERIRQQSLFTKCYEAGIEVKEHNKTTVVKVWQCD